MGAGSDANMLDYLAKEEIVKINRKIVAESSDPFGILNGGNLDYLTMAIPSKFNKHSELEAILHKSAELIDLIANKSHIFIEGNKRTAALCAIRFMEINGFELQYRPEELTGFILSVARNEKKHNIIVNWLRERIIKSGNHKPW